MTAPDSGSLAGRAVLVTGGSSGIGRAIALACARAGADVAVTYRVNARGGQAVCEAITALGRRAVALPLELEDVAAIAEAGRAARGALGRLDAWINNAGADVLTGDAAARSDLEKLDLLMRVDLRGTVAASWCAAEMLAAEPGGGVIVNMSWDHVATGMAGPMPQLFAAVKGGVQAFSKSLARSVAPRVRVNVIAPGWISTAFGDSLDDAARDAIARTTPLARWGTPEDVAAAAVFLASPAAAFITGHTIVVGGGAVMA